MGLPVMRSGVDLSQGHSCFPARKSMVMGSPNVKINGLPAHRATDFWESHSCGQVTHELAITVMGSYLVKVNGLGLARTTDAISCGDTCGAGSLTVNAG